MRKMQLRRLAFATLGAAVVAGTVFGANKLTVNAAKSGYSTDGHWDYDTDEYVESEWKLNDKYVDGERKYWLENKNTGAYLSNGWYMVNYYWYYFDENGYALYYGSDKYYSNGYKYGYYDYAQEAADSNQTPKDYFTWEYDDGETAYERYSKLNDPMSWQNSGSGWYYGNEAGGYLASGWTLNWTDSETGEEHWTWNNGVYNIDGSWYAFDQSGYNITSEGWINTAGTDSSKYIESRDAEWRYVNSDGTLATGWKQIDGKWYYFDDDAVLYIRAGWYQTSWKNSNGEYDWNYRSGQARIDDETYFFDENGALRGEGWLNKAPEDAANYDAYLNANWVYVEADGTAAKGWKKIDGNWYYFWYEDHYYSNGDYSFTSYFMCHNGMYNLASGASVDTYVFNQDGTLATAGWVGIENWRAVKDYSVDSYYSPTLAWNQDKTTWYYVDANGQPYTGWQKIDGSWYHFSDNEAYLNSYGNPSMSAGGVLERGIYVDGYWLDADTGVAADEKADWHQGEGGSYWYGTDSYYLGERWIYPDGYYRITYDNGNTTGVEWYTPDAYLGSYSIDGTDYRFTQDGYYYYWKTDYLANGGYIENGVADWFKDYVKDEKPTNTWYTYKMDEEGSIYTTITGTLDDGSTYDYISYLWR